MFQRNISTSDIRYIIENREIIEDYIDDELCPYALFLGLLKTKPIHIVMTQCGDHVRIITVCIPDKDKWIDYKIKKDKV
jgi:hypothetical protein